MGLWNKWKNFATKVGNFQARFILTFLYFTIMAIPGTIVTRFADFLNLKKVPKWANSKKRRSNFEDVSRQW